MSISDAVNVPLIVCTNPGQIEHLNPAACELLRFDPRSAVGLDLSVLLQFEDLSEQDRLRLKRRGPAALAGRETRAQATRRDGVSESVTVHIGPLDGVTKDEPRFVLTLQPVQLSPDETANAASGWSSIMTNAQVAIIECGLDGVVHGWSDGAAALYGWSSEEMTGRYVTTLVPDDRPDDISADLHRLRNGKEVDNRETTRLTRDRSRIWVSQTLIARRDHKGQTTGALIFARDIGPRRSMERQLRQSEAVKTAIIESAVDGILTVDSSGIIRSFNAAAERIFGWPASQIVGKPLTLLMPMPQRDRHPEYVAAHLLSGRADASGMSREVTGQRKDGSLFPIRVSVGTARVGDDTILTAIVHDVSREREIQQALDEQRLQLLSVAEAIDEPIFVCEPSTKKILYRNQAFVRVWGNSSVQTCRDTVLKNAQPCPGCADHPINVHHTRSYDRQDQTSHRWYHCIEKAIRWSDGRPVRFQMATDITERIHSERKLRSAVARLKTLIGNLQEGILVEDEEGRIVYTNNEFCELFGIEAGPRALIGQNCREAAGQAADLFCDTDRFADRIGELLEQSTPVRAEELHLKDGRTLERDYTPIWVANNYRGHLWQYRDITERRLYESRLREESHFRQVLLDSLPFPVFYKDADLKYQGCNASFCEALGVQREDIVNKAVDELVTDHTAAIYMEADRELLASGDHQVYQAPFINAPGEERTVQFHKAVFTDRQGNTAGIIGAMIDVTEQITTELELRRHRELLQSIVTHIPYAVFWKDVNGVYLGCNAAFAEQMGLSSPQEVIGRTDRDLAQTSFEMLSSDEDDRKVLNSGRPFVDVEESFMDSEGRTITRLKSRVPLRDKDDQVVGLVGIWQDISDRKVMEDELRMARDHAEEATRAKSAFLATMSHELRTPLNSIIGFADLALRSSEFQLPDKIRDYIQTVTRNGKHLLNLINDILDIAKIEAGRVDLQPRSFNLASLLRGSLKMLASLASKGRIQLISEFDDDIPLFADDQRIRQVVYNLLSNAVKFTPEGGQVGLRANVEENQIEISVWDTGIGISPADQELIFGEFHQVDRSYARRFKGTGLGLALSRKYVELLGGQIWVTSALGKGSRFTFTLPNTSPAGLREHDDTATGEVLASGNGRSVLVVDDEPDNLRLLTELLQARDWHTHGAEDGQKALEMTARLSFDLILLDIEMPGMDGGEVLDHLRRDTRTADLPVVAVTAHAMRGQREQLLQAGFDGYVSKPVDDRSLCSEIASVLAQQEDDGENRTDEVSTGPASTSRETAGDNLSAGTDPDTDNGS